MAKLICPVCMAVHEAEAGEACLHCGAGASRLYDFTNSDEYLKREVPRVLEERKDAGLEGLVGGLECIIVNTEPERQEAAAGELLWRTGYDFAGAFEDERYRTCVLRRDASADVLVRSRKTDDNPFAEFNAYPRSMHLPGTRLETFVFSVTDIETYVSIQKSRGVRFLSGEIVNYGGYLFIQTVPSSFTGDSIGFIQWKKNRGSYATSKSKSLGWSFKKPRRDYLSDIGVLDHAATRVRAEERDPAIIEFMELTNYSFEFAIYVKLFNSITNVARLSEDEFALVFTSGIYPYKDDETSGPTEKFIHNYGQRVHHMAFRTERIEETFEAIRGDGMEFLIDLVGSPGEGLKQTFSAPSEHTLLVNEYIHRYGDFDGFFTRSNVTLLTGATGKQ